MSRDLNVLGEPLTPCCHSPKTGFYRDGFCRVGPEDTGVHAVCAIMTDEFLAFSKAQGNDLTTPRPEFGFPGLGPGDRWCLCASRWQQAADIGIAPPVILSGTNERALEFTTLEILRQHALDLVH
ncbi:DUF2237 family protein [Vreelandella populi]|uniref:DUF2237 domain-containing protein n=1 Tax=Vreelandella populi TaxID=2498858 RepID=A0A433L9X9_9GAMM|nr:DUF2237 domain-containing protein [Halomonas populi]RUR41291.1 DUF2237 domain-containing protein [Halomonas populi]RUR44304.1 DUF2237 domain-containing protein [Halomonas populi]RUR56296.1 DUF2237 domain-containing protein [Halomonas populi]